MPDLILQKVAHGLCGEPQTRGTVPTPSNGMIEMLVLSRKTNERILVGDNIEIAVLEIRHGVVRIGINAPRDVAVIRSELRDQNSGEERLAVRAQQDSLKKGVSRDAFVDAPSDQMLHNFCERRRTWRTSDAVVAASALPAGSIEVGCNGDLCFG